MLDFLKSKAQLQQEQQQRAASRSRYAPEPKQKHWLLPWIDLAIAFLMKLATWGLILGIAVLDLVAVAVTLIIAFQDDLPEFLVDFVKEYVFSSQKHIRLRLQMLNLEGIADLMRDSLKALGLLWIAVTVMTLLATVLTRYVWHRRTRKSRESDSRLGRSMRAGEVLVPLHDPLMLEMDDEFSRFVHLYAFYLDLRCRSPDDASRVAQTMDSLKKTLSLELVRLAEGQVVQVKRDDAITALSEAARAVTGGGIVGVILRSSDYHRLRKPESAISQATPPAGAKPKMKLSTSWGAKPYKDVGAGPAGAEMPGGDAAPPAVAAEAAPAAAPEGGPLKPLDPSSLIAEKARDALAGLRG